MNHATVNKIASATVVVLVFATASTHFAVNTTVEWPCTVNPVALTGSVVACAPLDSSAISPRITYAGDTQSGEMVMTVEF